MHLHIMPDQTDYTSRVVCISKPRRDYLGVVTLKCPECEKETHYMLDEKGIREELIIVENDACSHVSHYFVKPRGFWQSA